MSYIVFISHSLHWRYIKTALQEYVIILFLVSGFDKFFAVRLMDFYTNYSQSRVKEIECYRLQKTCALTLRPKFCT